MHETPPPSDGHPPNYRIYVAGCDLGTISAAFPALEASADDGLVILSGAMERDDLDALVRQVKSLGHQVAAVMRED